MVLDPLYAAMSGAMGEEEHMRWFTDSCNNLIYNTGVAIIIVTHPRKHHTDNKGKALDLGDEEILGSKVLAMWADTIIWLRDRGGNDRDIQFSKVRYSQKNWPTLPLWFNKPKIRLELM